MVAIGRPPPFQVFEPASLTQSLKKSVAELGNLLCKLRLAVSSLILVDNTLRNSLVQLAAGFLESCGCNFSITGSNSFAGLAYEGLELGLVCLVADATLLVGLDALLLGLNVCHLLLFHFSYVRFGTHERNTVGEGLPDLDCEAWGHPWIKIKAGLFTRPGEKVQLSV